MVIAATVGSRADAAEAPGVDESVEGVVVAVLEEERHDHALEEVGLQHLP